MSHHREAFYRHAERTGVRVTVGSGSNRRSNRAEAGTSLEWQQPFINAPLPPSAPGPTIIVDRPEAPWNIESDRHFICVLWETRSPLTEEVIRQGEEQNMDAGEAVLDIYEDPSVLDGRDRQFYRGHVNQLRRIAERLGRAELARQRQRESRTTPTGGFQPRSQPARVQSQSAATSRAPRPQYLEPPPERHALPASRQPEHGHVELNSSAERLPRRPTRPSRSRYVPLPSAYSGSRSRSRNRREDRSRSRDRY